MRSNPFSPIALVLVAVALSGCAGTLSYASSTPPMPTCFRCTEQVHRVEGKLRELGYVTAETTRGQLTSDELTGLRNNGEAQERITVLLHYVRCEVIVDNMRSLYQECMSNHPYALVTVSASTGSDVNRTYIAATERQRRDADLLVRQISEIFTQ